MTILKVVAVYDAAVESYNHPFFVPAVGAAMRSFIDEVNRKDSPLSAHPTDYELFHLGDFESSDGSFEALKPRLLLSAKDVSRGADEGPF